MKVQMTTYIYYPHVVFLLAIVLPVLRFMASDYPFGIFRLCAIVLPVLRFMASDYPFGIFKLFSTCNK